MPLELKIVSEHAELVGDDFVREFREDGGTIGRSLQNDWILPDPDRFISGRHATIDHKGGIYYLLDTSSNGIYVNDEIEPIGKGNSRRLFNGDKLRMGDFIFEVAIDSGESLVVPLEDEDKAVSSNIESLVEEVSLKTGIKLLDEEEISGKDVFESALFGTSGEAAELQPEPKSVPELKPDPEVRQPQKRAASDGRKDDTNAMFNAFLEGLGLSQSELNPNVSRSDLMKTAGLVLRELIKGQTNLLASRNNLKHTFSLDQTTLLPRDNNPMKFSENTDDLLRQLLTGSAGDYLVAADAVREVNRDLLHHQNAFIDAMNSAFIEFADSLDPVELQEGFDANVGGRKWPGFVNRARYWQMYCDLYPVLTEKGGGRFPQMFGEEFVRAYERQVEEYRRRDVNGDAPKRKAVPAVDPGLQETQKLDGPELSVVDDADETADDTSNELIITTKDLSMSAADEIDQRFIDELESSMADDLDIDFDRMKA